MSIRKTLQKRSTKAATDNFQRRTPSRKILETLKTSVFSFIMVNLGILHALITAGVKLEGRGGGDFPCPSSKAGKMFLDFEKKCPDSGHLLVKFLFKMYLLSFSRKRNPKFSPLQDPSFLSCR